MSKASKKRAVKITLESARQLIGKRVEKYSGKPFKSGNKINTVRDVVDHAQKPTGGLAFVFNEDDSAVSVELCKEI